MNVRKFIAPNAREALRKVKEMLGPDAIILSNRGVPGGVEIMAVAARDMAMIVPGGDEDNPPPRPSGGGMAQQPPAPPPRRNLPLPDEDDYHVSLSHNPPRQPPQQPPLSRMPDPPPSMFGPSRTGATASARTPVPPPLPPHDPRQEPVLSRQVPPPAGNSIPPPPRSTFGPPPPQGGGMGTATRQPPPPHAHTAASTANAPRPAAFRPAAEPAGNLQTAAPPVPQPPMTLSAERGMMPVSSGAMSGPAGALAVRPGNDPAEVVPAAVMEEIRALRRIVEQHLAGFAWGETGRNEPVKIDVLRQMLDLGFSPQFTRELLSDLPSDLDVTQAMVWVRGAADRTLMTIGSEADIVDRGGVYALVGPTGVGKTTTTAKLAARSVLRQGPNKVALITTDGYRIGAHEQLRIYGRILGVSVYLVKDAAELRQTLAELQYKHLILIDTMGMSQKDKSVPELTGMLSDCNVRRLLLFSATSRGDTLDDIIHAYQGPELVGTVLTKVDEAASLATALDAIMRNNLRLFYVSNGQRVPEDLHLPNRAYLLHRAFKDLPEGSAHRFDGLEPGLVMANAGLFAAGGGRG